MTDVKVSENIVNLVHILTENDKVRLWMSTLHIKKECKKIKKK